MPLPKTENQKNEKRKKRQEISQGLIGKKRPKKEVKEGSTKRFNRRKMNLQ